MSDQWNRMVDGMNVLKEENERLRREVRSWEACDFERQLSDARKQIAELYDRLELICERCQEACHHD